MSIKLIPYHNIREEIIPLSFIDQSTTRIHVICPEPSFADHLREYFDASHDSRVELSVATLSAFFKRFLDNLCPDMDVKSMSELAMSFATIWKIKEKNLNFESFHQALELFRVLRTYSLDINVLQEVLKHFDPRVVKILATCWQLLTLDDYVDEPRAFNLVSQHLRSVGIDELRESSLVFEKDAFVFLGFKDLNAYQIDFLKAIAEKAHVYIAIPETVLLNASISDWPLWLSSQDVSSDLREKEAIDRNLKIEAKIIRFSKNRMSQKLRDCVAEDNLNQIKLDIFLGTEYPNFSQVMEVPFDGAYFRPQAQIFNAEFVNISNMIFQELTSAPEEEHVLTDSMIEFLIHKINQLVASAPEKRNNRELKILLLYRRYFLEWKELSKYNESISVFDFKVLEFIINQNLPKIFCSPLSLGLSNHRIKGLELIDTYDVRTKSFLCVSSDYTNLKSSKINLNPEVLNLLAPIGPIPNESLQEIQLRSDLINILISKDNILLLEDGIENTSPFWNSVFEGFDNYSELNNFSEPQVEHSSALKDIVSPLDRYVLGRSDSVSSENKIGKSISASKLQIYRDCPRKYYFTYIQDFALEPQIDEQVAAKHLGIIEHKVIETYFNNIQKYQILDSDFHEKIVSSVFTQFILENKLILNSINYNRYFVEIKDYTKNAIELMLGFIQLYPDSNLLFESKLKQQNIDEHKVSGSIDLLIDGKVCGILDFKRSAMSIPSQKEIENFDKIQLYFYLLNIPLDRSPDFWGYICLGDLSKSLIWVANENLLQQWKIISENYQAFKVVNVSNSWQEKMPLFKQEIIKTVNKIKDDELFKPKPNGYDVCDFCQLNNICPKQ